VTAWWQRGAIYQIYPRSFADGDGDGVGDVRGIAARLDHLSELGVAAIWLSPIYPSPMADFGYDVADYRDVDPVFGTLADFDALVAACHARDIRVVIDWVPNHSSDQHPWFRASRSRRDDSKRDWYVWRDGAAGGGPPNDWRSEFRAVGPAWTFDERTGQWYLHSFLPQQPDLNWDNPAVEEAMHDVLRFWLRRGVDGFRIDALQRLAHDPLLRDNAGAARRRDQDWETANDRVRRIRRVVEEFDDRMIVGEVALLDLPRVVSYLGAGDQLHLVHNFVFLDLPWDAAAFRVVIDEFEALAEDTAWPAWMPASHDHSRVATRYDGDGRGPARARAMAVLLYGLRGTPFVYQGEELGLPDAEIPPERVVDVDGRDPERAPIPWRPPSVAGPGAGFTSGEPWLPLVAGAEDLCAERQAADPQSTLALFRSAAALRAATPALQTGAQRMLDTGVSVLAWLREEAGDRLLVALNFAAGDAALPLSSDGTVLLSTDPGRAVGELQPAGSLQLGSEEAVVLRLDAVSPPPSPRPSS
jgi:alpha-glucosidase